MYNFNNDIEVTFEKDFIQITKLVNLNFYYY